LPDSEEKRLRQIIGEVIESEGYTVIQELSQKNQQLRREIVRFQALSLVLLIILQICLSA
jgi:hypothetical protein